MKLWFKILVLGERSSSECMKLAAFGLQFRLSQAQLNNYIRFIQGWVWTSDLKWAKMKPPLPNHPVMKQGAWKCFPLQIRAKKKDSSAAGGGEREGTNESGGSHGGSDGSWGQQKCLCVRISIYCWRHVSERPGDSGPNNSSSHPENLPSQPPQSHVSAT